MRLHLCQLENLGESGLEFEIIDCLSGLLLGRDELYEKYAIDILKKEGVETAVERSIKTMMDWADEQEAPWNDYFRYASLNRVTQHLRDGKISAWLVLNCTSGKEMLSKFNDEQLGIVYAVMDPQHWAIRFKRSPVDVELVKEIAQKANL